MHQNCFHGQAKLAEAAAAATKVREGTTIATGGGGIRSDGTVKRIGIAIETGKGIAIVATGEASHGTTIVTARRTDDKAVTSRIVSENDIDFFFFGYIFLKRLSVI